MAEYTHVTPEDIFRNEEVRAYIQQGNDNLGVIGFTEHGLAHAKKSSDTAREILRALGYPQRDCELAAIAGYMHDIGNTVNRVDHAHSGALMAFALLNKLNMPPQEIGLVCSAIGHHDEKTAFPALIAWLVFGSRIGLLGVIISVSYTHLAVKQGLLDDDATLHAGRLACIDLPGLHVQDVYKRQERRRRGWKNST